MLILHRQLQSTTSMSTPIPSSVQPTSTNTSSGSVSETFSPARSPALILAFLSIGLFSVAMIFIFWRRIQAHRRWRMRGGPLGLDRSYLELPIIDANVPKLWDLSNAGSSFAQNEKGGTVPEVDVRWVNIMVHTYFFFFFFQNFCHQN